MALSVYLCGVPVLNNQYVAIENSYKPLPIIYKYIIIYKNSYKSSLATPTQVSIM